MRGATCVACGKTFVAKHFNPRSSCEERHGLSTLRRWEILISIHAPHARSDVAAVEVDHRGKEISIHAPHARSDMAEPVAACHDKLFQSTLLMRGATRHTRRRWRRYLSFQSTLLMRGATREDRVDDLAAEFQSTLLMRGATRAR